MGYISFLSFVCGKFKFQFDYYDRIFQPLMCVFYVKIMWTQTKQKSLVCRIQCSTYY